jgi:hypothetical protein
MAALWIVAGCCAVATLADSYLHIMPINVPAYLGFVPTTVAIAILRRDHRIEALLYLAIGSFLIPRLVVMVTQVEPSLGIDAMPFLYGMAAASLLFWRNVLGAIARRTQAEAFAWVTAWAAAAASGLATIAIAYRHDPLLAIVVQGWIIAAAASIWYYGRTTTGSAVFIALGCWIFLTLSINFNNNYVIMLVLWLAAPLLARLERWSARQLFGVVIGVCASLLVGWGINDSYAGARLLATFGIWCLVYGYFILEGDPLEANTEPQ